MWPALAISLMKLAQSPITAISDMNWHARITLKVTPMAPSCGAWNRILKGPLDSKLVSTSSDGRLLLAVRKGNFGFGNGTVGGGGKEVLAEMVGNWYGVIGEARSRLLHTFQREDLRRGRETGQLPRKTKTRKLPVASEKLEIKMI